MSYHPNVQQRIEQRRATQFEALGVGLMPIMIMFAMLGSVILYLSTKYATWERETLSPLNTDYEPSLIAKPGLFASEHSETITTLAMLAAAIVLFVGFVKFAKWSTK